MATRQAQEILDNATIEANAVKSAAMQYTDSMLANLESVLKESIATAARDYNTLVGNLQEIENIVTANRAELVPSEESMGEMQSVTETDTGNIALI